MKLKSRLEAVADLRQSEYWEGLTFLDPKYDGAVIGVAESNPGRHAMVVYDKKRLANLGRTTEPKLSHDVLVLDAHVCSRSNISAKSLDRLAEGWDGGIGVFPDLVKGFVGLAQVSPRRAIAVYDRERVLKILRDGMVAEDEDDDVDTMAIEWYEFNTIGSWNGPKTPAIMMYLEDMTLD